MTQLKQFVVALIRTSIVPPIAGLVLTWFAKRGIEVSSTWVSSVLTVTLSGVWYITFHGIEVLAQKPGVKKWAGIFLGYPSRPRYNPPVGSGAAE